MKKYEAVYERWVKQEYRFNVVADDHSNARDYACETFDTLNEDGEVDWKSTNKADVPILEVFREVKDE